MGLRVPGVNRYSSPQVQTSIGPTVQQQAVGDANTFGAGPGLEKAGQGFMEVFAKEKNNADKVSALEAKTKLAAIATDLLYNPERGAFTKKGKNAFSTIDDVNSAYDKAFSEISDGLSNESQKQMLRADFEASKVDIQRQLSRHVSTEAQQYDDNTTRAGLEVEQTAVAANPLDNERRNAAIIKQKIMIDDFANRNGIPAEQRQLMLQEAENKTNLGAITTLVDSKDYLGAASYYNDVKETMTGEFRQKADRMVKESLINGQAAEKSREYSQKGLTLTQATAEIQKIEDPELKKATYQQVKMDYDMRKVAEADRAENINKSVASQIDRGTLWKDIPQSTKDLLTSQQRSTLQSYAEERAKGRDVPAGGKLYYDTFSIATNPATRNQFMRENLYSTIYGKVSKSEFDELYKLQNGLKNGSAKELNDADDLFSNKQIAESIAKSNGIYAANDDSESKQETYRQYQTSLNRELRRFQTNTGKKPTSDDVQRIADSLLIEKKVNDNWFGNTKRRFEVDPGVNVDITYEDIPAREKALIAQAAKEAGATLNEQDVVDLYIQKTTGKR